MTTVVSRTFISSPQRNAPSTWDSITATLTQGRKGAALDELVAVA